MDVIWAVLMVLYLVGSSDFRLTFAVRLMRLELRFRFAEFSVVIVSCPPVTLFPAL